MNINLEFKIKPFSIPKTVTLIGDKSFKPYYPTGGMAPAPCAIPPYGPTSETPYVDGLYVNDVKLSAITPEALESLCEKFTESVFSEAGFSRPTQAEKEHKRVFVNDASDYNALKYDLIAMLNALVDIEQAFVDFTTHGQDDLFTKIKTTLEEWIHNHPTKVHIHPEL